MPRLLVKLLSLFSAVGGPLYLFDLLEPGWGRAAAFAFMFAPVGLMVLGVLTVLEEEPTRLSRAVAWGGLVGVALLTGMNGFTLWCLLGGAVHPNHGLILFGIVIGTVSSYLVTSLTRRFLADGGVSSAP
jgi:hypothetical protein